jgi:hypothetical protein
MPFLTSGGKSLPRGGLLPPDVRNGNVQAWDTVGERSHATLVPPVTTADTTQPSKKQKGKHLFNLNATSIENTSSTTMDSDLISLFLSPVSQQPLLEKRNKVSTLLDTGSHAGNFVAFRVLDNFSLTSYIKKEF